MVGEPIRSMREVAHVPDGVIVPLTDGETFARIDRRHPGAPTLLLLHGWLASADLNWFGCYGVLGERWNVIALDHRGHGRGLRSPRPFNLAAAADDAAELLDVLGVTGPVVAVGYSMGGLIALRLAQRHPARVQALVLTATALDFRGFWRTRLAWHGLGVLAAGLRFDGERRVVERLVTGLATRDELVAAWRPRLLGEATRLETRAAVQAGREVARFDANAWAGELHVPAGLLLTAADRLVSPASQQRLADVLGASVLSIEGDHDVVLRRPALFADSLRAVVSVVLERGATPSAKPRPPRQLGDAAGTRLRKRITLRRNR